MSRVLILEGGLYGHLNHLYDNPDFTFATIKKIFDTASSGKLIGTEKVDGQNLYLSYSVKDGVAKAARNKGNIRQGGMDAGALAAKFADRGNLTKAFTESFKAFEDVVQAMAQDKQLAIFGEDANVWYNAEIMDPQNMNVVKYSARFLTIHQQGHAEYDRETAKVRDSDVSGNVAVLQKQIDKLEDAQEDKQFTVKMNALKTLEALDNDAALREAVARIDKLTSSVGISDKNTIGEYIVAKLSPAISNKFPNLDEERSELLVKRMLGTGGVTVTAISKGLPPEEKRAISDFVKNEGKKVLGDIIYPLESIVHDFSVEMLKGMKSAYILNNDEEVSRLTGQVQAAIDAIENSGRDDIMKVMKRHLDKLGGSAESITTASEGFVFDWDGITYKFTGNFAPANQILGMFKYGRGNIPALQKEVVAEVKGGRTVGIAPGGYKPPHAGHFLGAKHLLDKGADEVVVLISPLEREGFSQDGESKSEISKRQSLQLWELYAEANGLVGRIIPKIASSESPVTSAYDFAATLSNDDTVLLGKGEKDAEDQRFNSMESFLAKKGLNIEVQQINTPMFSSGVSGTQMRRIIADGNLQEFKKHIPLKNTADIQAAWDIVTTENVEDTTDKKAREKAKEEKEAAKKAEKERKKAERAAARAAAKAAKQKEKENSMQESFIDMLERLISEAVRVDHEAVPDGQLGGPKQQRNKKKKEDDDDDGSVNVNVNVETNVDNDSDDEDKVDEANMMSAGGIEGHHVGGKKKGAWSGVDVESENDEQERQSKSNRSKIKKAKSDMIKEEVIHLDYGLGLTRAELPQVKSTDMADFRKWMEEQGVESFETKMEVGELNPIQREINTDKTDSMRSKHEGGTIDLISGKPIMVTMDEHLVDGHHRWYALRELDPQTEMETVNFNIPVQEFLQLVKQYPKVSFKDVTMEEGYENFGGTSQMIKVGRVRVDLEDVELEPSKHGEERRFRHQKGGKGHKISKDAIVMAVDRSIGLIMNDYANGEIGNDEAFHIRMKGKSKQVPALNVIAALDMKKGPDTIKVITVMRKDEFKTDNFGGGNQKTYNV